MDYEGFREAGYKAIDSIIEYYKELERAEIPVSSKVEPGYLKPLLDDEVPETGESWDVIHKDFQDKIVPGLTHWQHPNFYGFFPANTSFPSMLGELFSSAYAAPAFNWACSPAITELETIVLDQLGKAIGLPESFLSTNGKGGGVIEGTASDAISVVVIAARDRYLAKLRKSAPDLEDADTLVGQARDRLVALHSDQTHSSTEKASMIAGIKSWSIKTRPEDNYALTAESVANAINEVKKRGLIPIFLTASLGTTAVCALDDLQGIGQVLDKEPDVYGHIDAAYGGSMMLLPEYRHYMKGIEYFDSFNFNMHKALLVNIDAGMLYVQDRSILIDALSLTPAYLRSTEGPDAINYRDWQIPLGRRFRALKVWFVLRTYGLKGLRNHVARIIHFGDYFANLLKQQPDVFTIVRGPIFGLVVFYIKGGSTEKNVEITKKVSGHLAAEGRYFLTAMPFGNEYVIRFVAGSPQTTDEGVDQVYHEIARLAANYR